MKSKNWSALAMCIDCEGTISLGKHNLTRQVPNVGLDITIVNTDRRLMKWLIENFGGVYYHRPARNIKHKDCFMWRLTGKNNREHVLLGIIPHLIIKKEQAKLALEFLRLNGMHCPEQRNDLMLKCQSLNAKGPTATTNTLDTLESVKIESDLTSDSESAPLVIETA